MFIINCRKIKDKLNLNTVRLFKLMKDTSALGNKQLLEYSLRPKYAVNVNNLSQNEKNGDYQEWRGTGMCTYGGSRLSWHSAKI